MADHRQADAAALQRELEDLRARQTVLAARLDLLTATPTAPPAAPVSSLRLFEIQPVRDVMVIAALIGLLWLGKQLSMVTVPALLAMLLAYLFEPMVRAMTRRRWISRTGAALLIIITALVVVVVPIGLGVSTAVVQGSQVAQKVARTSQNLLDVMGFTRGVWEHGAAFGGIEVRADPKNPGHETLMFYPAPGNDEAARAAVLAQAAFERERSLQLRDGLVWTVKRHEENRAREAAAAAGDASGSNQPWWMASVDLTVAWVQKNSEAIATTVGKGALGTGGEALSAAFRTLQRVGEWGLMLLLTAFFFYFFSTGFGRVLAFWEGLIPERRKGRVIELVQRMDRVIAGFVRGRITICAILIAFYVVAYAVMGVPAPLLIGPIVGAIAIIPFMTIPAMPLVMILLIVEPGPAAWQQTWWCIIGGPILAYSIERILDDYILTPMIQGKTTEMSVPAILFASLAGGVLAGVYGLLIAIPVAACLQILMKEVFWPRFKLWAEGRQRDFLPISGSQPDINSTSTRTG